MKGKQELTITQIMSIAHRTACDKGWWDDEQNRSFGDQIALMHSELSEALEAFRLYHDPARELRIIDFEPVTDVISGHVTGSKPEGVAVEFADVIIRIADTCERYGIPLAEAIEEKMKYNKTRARRHGGKRM